MVSSYQDTGPSNTLNLLFSSSAEEFGLRDDRLLWELSLPQNFVVALKEQRKGFIAHHGRYFNSLMGMRKDAHQPTPCRSQEGHVSDLGTTGGTDCPRQ